MPRSARIEYPGAIYHVINRGNYRWDVFGSPGAAQAFVTVLEEAVKRYEWELGAYVVMRNHFHLAVRTPHPNLSAGMHWLQATFATRFNRLRGENGHLFQGRYKALLLEDEAVWARVADYIHLNPLRARVVTPELLEAFRWSSLSRFVKGAKFPGLYADGWLSTLGWQDVPSDWSHYVSYLRGVQAAEETRPETERERLSRGWAMGSREWKADLLKITARETPSAERAEYREPVEMQQLRWETRLNELMVAAGRGVDDLETSGRAARWKVEVADQLQREMGVPAVWLAEKLKTGRPASLRTMLWRRRSVDK